MSQQTRKQRETIIRFEELSEKWKRGEPIEQAQAEYDKRLLGGTGPASVEL